MKKIALLNILLLLVATTSIAQTNTFPSSGRAGIGTTSPSAELEVKSGTSNNAEVHINSLTDGTPSIIRFQDAGQSTWGFLSNYPNAGKFSLYNYGNNSNAIVLNSNGNVGIGTTIPEEKLHIKNGSFMIELDSQYNTDPKVVFKNDIANPFQTFYRWTGSGTSYYASRFLHEGNKGFKIQMGGTEAYGNHTFTDALTVLNNGNIGIGTTNPKSKLHIISNSSDELSTNNYDAGLIVEGTHNSRSTSKGSTIGFVVPANTNGSNPWQQGRIMVTPDNEANYNASGRMLLQTRYLSNGAWRWQNNLILKSDGNVGIGTTTPDAKLAVNGTIHTKEVKVDLVGWPDYVFEDNYTLPTLEQVEQHITEKGHLQNIPSASEVAENGIQLGEMNKKLLEKIEELTLYMIEQNKKTDLLLQEVEALKKKNTELEQKIN